MASKPPKLVIFGFPLELLIGIEPEPWSEREEQLYSEARRNVELAGINELAQDIRAFEEAHSLDNRYFG